MFIRSYNNIFVYKYNKYAYVCFPFLDYRKIYPIGITHDIIVRQKVENGW